MNNLERKKLIEAWVICERNFWAMETLRKLITDNPDEAWETIKGISECENNEDILGDLGADPLEDFIDEHRIKYIDKIEEYSRNNPKFKVALAGVWLSNDNDEIYKRLISLGCDVAKIKR